MKEVFRVQSVLAEARYRPAPGGGLTPEPQTSYPRAGVLFMDDGRTEVPQGVPGEKKAGHEEVSPRVKQPSRLRSYITKRVLGGFVPTLVSTREQPLGQREGRISEIRSELTGAPAEKRPEDLRNEWQAALTPQEWENPGIRSGVESAISHQYEPHRVTSKEKDPTKPGAREAIEVVRNSVLSQPEHLKKAQEVLGQELKPEQHDLIWEAHTKFNLDSDGHPASVYDLAPEQLRKKVEILKKAGFDEEQMRKIIESGLALHGATPPGPTPGGYSEIDALRARLLRINQFASGNEDQLNALFQDANILYGRSELTQDFLQNLDLLSADIGQELQNANVRRILENQSRRKNELKEFENGKRDANGDFELDADGEPVELGVKWVMEKARERGDDPRKELRKFVDSHFNLSDPNLDYEKLAIMGRYDLNPDSARAGTYGYALEYLMERVISLADITPKSKYPDLTFYQRENLTRIVSLVRDLDIDKKQRFYSYVKELQEKRYVAHEFYRNMRSKEAFVQIVTEHLNTTGLDFLENEIAGVAYTQIAWEKQMSWLAATNQEWLGEKENLAAKDEVKKMINQQIDRDKKMQDKGLTGQSVLRKDIEIEVDESAEPIEGTRGLDKWEIDRANVVGNAMAAGRKIVYSVFGDVPKDMDERLTSLDSEFIARIMAVRKILQKRFIGIGKVGGKYLSLRHKHASDLARLKGKSYGYKGEGEKETGLYGKSAESWQLLDTRITDGKSHLWRTQRMFTKDEEHAKITAKGKNEAKEENSPEAKTIGDYLNAMWRLKTDFKDDKGKELEGKKLDKALDEPYNGVFISLDSQEKVAGADLARFNQELTRLEQKRITVNADPNASADDRKQAEQAVRDIRNKIEDTTFRIESIQSERTSARTYVSDPSLELITVANRKKEVIFSHFVRDEVLKQRLNLGTLVRQDHLTPELRAQIWKNAARLLPTRIAALFIDETKEIWTKHGMEQDEFKALYDKLGLLENARVYEDAQKIKKEGIDAFSLRRPVKDELLSRYAVEGVDNVDTFSPTERNVIEEIIALGEEKSGDIARIISNFTLFLDDTPRTAWKNISEADLQRIYVSDWEHYEKANTAITQIIANPTMPPEESAKLLVVAVNEYDTVHGRYPAQETFEADTMTRYDFFERYGLTSDRPTFWGGLSDWGLFGFRRFTKRPTSLAEEYNIESGISMTVKDRRKDASELAKAGVINTEDKERDAKGRTQFRRIMKKVRSARELEWGWLLRLFTLFLGAAAAKQLLESLKYAMPDDLSRRY